MSQHCRIYPGSKLLHLLDETGRIVSISWLDL